MDVKNVVTQVVKYPFRPRVKHPIIIAGLGRCGTTLLHTAIYRTTRNHKTFVTELDKVDDFGSSIIKTHDYPPQKALPAGTKVVFMFGDVVNTVISTSRMMNSWGVEHFHHLRSDNEFTKYVELFHEDKLQLERMFDDWYRPQPFDFFTMRYETMYEPATQEALKAYLGFDPALPPFRPRKARKEGNELADIATKTYASLIEKLNKADNFKHWPSAK